MAYERNTLEGIRSWLVTEVSTPGWHASSIAKGLTEDVMTIIGNHVNEFDSRTKQGLLLSILCMRKNDIMFLNNDIKKIIECSLKDPNEFVDIVAHVLEPYPTNQQLNIKIDTWSDGFNNLLQSLGNKISENGFKFHTHEDMLLQPNARTAPLHASANYMDFKPTEVHHFTLTNNTEDIVMAESRHARFKELVESEERSEQAEAQAAQVAAKKRAGADLTGPTKRTAVSSPTIERPNPFPPHRGSVPISPGGVVRPPPPRSMSVGSAQSSSSLLFNKRAARPAPGGGLFVTKPKPHAARPIQRSTSGTLTGSNLPRGLQRVQKTQMLDFNAATEMEQNNANAIKEAQDQIQAEKDAKKQEVLERRQRAADEKRERDEARKAARAAAERERALAREAAERERALAREAAARARAEAEEAAAAAAAATATTSVPTSPKTPTSPISPIKYEQQDDNAPNGNFTTF